MSESHDPGGEPLDRRAAIKKAVVGAVAGGVIWSAPRIEGLTLRPSYAGAQTGPPPQTLALTIVGPMGFSSTALSCSTGPGGLFAAVSRTTGGAAAEGSYGFFMTTGTVNALNITPGTWSIQRSSPGATANFSANLISGDPNGPMTVSVEFDCA